MTTYCRAEVRVSPHGTAVVRDMRVRILLGFLECHGMGDVLAYSGDWELAGCLNCALGSCRVLLWDSVHLSGVKTPTVGLLSLLPVYTPGTRFVLPAHGL